MVGQGMKPVANALAAGFVAALAATRLLQSMLYGVGPRDPTSLAAVAGVLAAVALVASWLPARRASRVDPIVALRGD
jgi:ABC-type antimicrobial peptide transport system permease subunit